MRFFLFLTLLIFAFETPLFSQCKGGCPRGYTPPPAAYTPDPILLPNGCPRPPGCCYPDRFCCPYCNPYAPPPEGCCCPPAPILATTYGLNVFTMAFPIFLIVGISALILSHHGHH